LKEKQKMKIINLEEYKYFKRALNSGLQLEDKEELDGLMQIF